MTVAALVLYGAYLSLGFGWRSWIQWRRTGDTGFRGVSGRPGTPEWWAGVLFVGAVVTGALGPVAALVGLDSVAALDAEPLKWVGLTLAVAGIGVILLTQVQMGTNWRIGVDESETTELVSAGLFGLVRNPFFSGTVVTGAGLSLMVPNVVSLLGLALVVVAVELQVRVVEEPHLRQVHGAAYLTYSAWVGRFVPMARVAMRSDSPLRKPVA